MSEQKEKLSVMRKIFREIKRPFQQFVRNHDSRYLYNELTCFVQRAVSTAILHQKTFSRFKNVHQGQEIVLVATGPSVKHYKRIDHAVHVGVNSAFKIEHIDLSYLFMVDYANVKPYIKEANRYQPDRCVKFYGLIDWVPGYIIPESDVIEAHALRFRERDYANCHISPTCLIDSESFDGRNSVVFSAMQFVLWTNPQTIYLVGCDCSTGHFDESPREQKMSKNELKASTKLISSWLNLKEFAHLYYPETEIKSINPVGLKGIFEEHKQ
jgi:hypothetical protein